MMAAFWVGLMVTVCIVLNFRQIYDKKILKTGRVSPYIAVNVYREELKIML